mmetsp:Transcript_121178/g.302417  ORF Transcript_121178/g.302417 Transcript_121178/m.302417 type:complete len:252 (+) Transcript_121178:169-924(+)
MTTRSRPTYSYMRTTSRTPSSAARPSSSASRWASASPSASRRPRARARAAWPSRSSQCEATAAAAAAAPAPLPLGTPTSGDAAGGGGISLPIGAVPGSMPAHLDSGSLSPSPPVRKGGAALWERVLELCETRHYLDAYKQVIAEPEESCLLRLMQHTGPIVEHLDAESNSRLIRRLIHILSSPSKEPAMANIDQIFAWLWQALKTGIHFTASQIEDLASALQKVSSASSQLPTAERAEAAQLLARFASLRK